MEIVIFIVVVLIFLEMTFLLISEKVLANLLDARRGVFVDTSVLIDGRILDIFQTGFIDRQLLIPQSVLGELQMMADKADGEKRDKARYGLDIIQELQAIDKKQQIKIFKDKYRHRIPVDEQLLRLTKRYQGALCTVDYNLNKVAKVEGIEVLNINDLALAVRSPYLLGDKVRLKLTGKGSNTSQAVGHLDDGTMVVVEKASNLIGKVVEVELQKNLQTVAGKMIFAKLTIRPRK